MQDEREKVKAAHPNAGFAESNKILGANWQALPESKKQVIYRIIYFLA